MKPFRLCYTDEARVRIRHLHPAIKQHIRDALRRLEADPWQGKPLQRELAGLFALRIRHYRVLYCVLPSQRRIDVLTLGPRKTIYTEATKRRGTQ